MNGVQIGPGGAAFMRMPCRDRSMERYAGASVRLNGFGGDFFQYSEPCQIDLQNIYGFFIKTDLLPSRSFMHVLTSMASYRAVTAQAGSSARNLRAGRLKMDILMLALGGGFFALAAGYCFACDRL